MPLQLWSGQGGHYFVDTFPDYEVHVGQAFQEQDGTWTVEVNDEFLTAPDLETAKRLFIENYDRAKVQLSPGTFSDESVCAPEEFTIVDLSPPHKPTD